MKTARPSGLSLVKRREPEPSAELIDEALECLMRSDLVEFATNLEIARLMWRKFRELVEGPCFPEQLRAAFVEELRCEPEQNCGLGEKVLEPGHRESLRPRAVQMARRWMQKERSSASSVAERNWDGS